MSNSDSITEAKIAMLTELKDGKEYYRKFIREIQADIPGLDCESQQLLDCCKSIQTANAVIKSIDERIKYLNLNGQD